MEIDASLPNVRLVKVFEQLKPTAGYPMRYERTTAEPLGKKFTDRRANSGIRIDYIEPGKPNQNTCIKLFNWSYRTCAQYLSVQPPAGIREIDLAQMS